MIEGGCLCGLVTYQYNGEIQEIAYCHCSQCRRAQGGPHAANCPVDESKLTFRGHENISEYQSSDTKIRAFCKNCGSALYSAQVNLPGIKRLRLGSVTTEFSCGDKYHIWAASKASWHQITDSYPRFTAARDLT